ncbi:hypothetical protein AAC691_17075 [Nguyenibacter vanlangensis]|uniref:3-oxoacyl-[acyl-carrier-protein] synthase-3 n=1 Tax=Nguyenibacter vanlangensis TaxID=1216886 RepID=A0ABZ3D2S5_9PROT
MSRVFIHSIGVHAERCSGLAALAQAVNMRESPSTTPASVYAAPSITLGAAALAAIAREDRSTLSPHTVASLNAMADALSGNVPGNDAADQAANDDHENVPVFTATDSAEYGFTSLCGLMAKYPGREALMNHLGEIRDYGNPLNMMRLLSTNTLYHASKRLEAHGGGYPIRAMSLSGLCALEDAWREIMTDRAPNGAAVVASGNMRSFDALVAFGKMGLVGKDEEPGQIDPTFGAAALMLSAQDHPYALAEIIDASSLFAPEPWPQAATWKKLFTRAKEQCGTPDIIVAYRNGAPLLDAAEREALAAIYPDVPQKAFKNLIGYTGKPNNLLDLAAILVDATVPPGALIMINGAGLGWGVGCITLRKIRTPSTH